MRYARLLCSLGLFGLVVSAASTRGVISQTTLLRTTQTSLSTTASNTKPSCTPLPGGSIPTVEPDTPEGFSNSPLLNAASDFAPFIGDYSKLWGSEDGALGPNFPGYLGYTLVPDFFDAKFCARKCCTLKSCETFNIYYQRSPSIDPGNGTQCPNPPSVTQIRCNFYSTRIDFGQEYLLNKGQYRNKFQVVIGGSTGYSKYRECSPPPSVTTTTQTPISTPTATVASVAPGFKLTVVAPGSVFDNTTVAGSADPGDVFNFGIRQSNGDQKFYPGENFAPLRWTYEPATGYLRVFNNASSILGGLYDYGQRLTASGHVYESLYPYFQCSIEANTLLLSCKSSRDKTGVRNQIFYVAEDQLRDYLGYYLFLNDPNDIEFSGLFDESITTRVKLRITY